MAKHHYCRQVNVVDERRIFGYVRECFSDKWTRSDVLDFLTERMPGFSRSKVKRMVRSSTNRAIFDPVLHDIAAELSYEISHRDIHLAPIRYREKYDPNSKKTRVIGVEGIKQQLYDFITVKSAKEVWDKRIGCYQCASIPGEGQVYGKKLIQKWLRTEPELDNSYAVKGDVKKCYPSIDREILKKKLKKDISNPDLIYLMFTLIDSYQEGLSIGSYLSQYLCNYYLSFAYRLLETQYKCFYTHVIFYMDDFLILSRTKEDVTFVMEEIIKFFKEELNLTIKPNWELFPVDHKDEKGKRHGRPIDMMGYIIYRDHTAIRPGIFLRTRRTYSRAAAYSEKYPHPRMPLFLSYKCVSYYGWLVNSDSKSFIFKNNVKKRVGLSKASISYYAKLENGEN